MENKTNKVLVWLVVILIVLVVALMGFIVYREFYSEEKTSVDNTTNKIISTKDVTYEMKSSNILGKLLFESEGDLSDLLDDDNNIRLHYPVISGDSQDIKNLNNKILTQINTTINNLQGIKQEKTDENYGCYEIKLTGDSESSIFEHFNYFRYDVEETDEKIIIKEYIVASTGCATGNEELYYTYTVDKNSESVIEKANPESTMQF